MAFLLVNKITKRHVSLIQRRADAEELIVANLDDPSQVAEAAAMDGEISQIAAHDAQERQELFNEERTKEKFGKGYDQV